MTILVQATKPPASKHPSGVRVALLYAAMLVIFSVMQLFSFEEFLPLVGDFALPGGRPFAYFLSAYIVMAEIFALPFLLRMRLSPAMRLVSMAMGWIVALLWVFVAVWLMATSSTVTNIGFFGHVIAFSPGWAALAVAFLLFVMSAWASSGMWPLTHRK